MSCNLLRLGDLLQHIKVVVLDCLQKSTFNSNYPSPLPLTLMPQQTELTQRPPHSFFIYKIQSNIENSSTATPHPTNHHQPATPIPTTQMYILCTHSPIPHTHTPYTPQRKTQTVPPSSIPHPSSFLPHPPARSLYPCPAFSPRHGQPSRPIKYAYLDP